MGKLLPAPALCRNVSSSSRATRACSRLLPAKEMEVSGSLVPAQQLPMYEDLFIVAKVPKASQPVRAGALVLVQFEKSCLVVTDFLHCKRCAPWESSLKAEVCLSLCCCGSLLLGKGR